MMKYMYVLGASIFVWLNFHLAQGGDKTSPATLIGSGVHANRVKPDEVICSLETFREIMQCAKDIILLQRKGFPWGVADLQKPQHLIRDCHPDKYDHGDIKDPLDRINHVCKVFDDFLKCLDLNAIAGECLLSGDDQLFQIHTTFTFICHIQPRSTDLLHSLRCLQESRVADLLIFLLANNPNSHIDDMAQGTVNALFRFLTHSDVLVNTYFIFPIATDFVVSDGLICLPKSVISRDVYFLVSNKCGDNAADVVRDYYFYFRKRFLDGMRMLGLSTICDPIVDGTVAAPDAAERDSVFGSSLFDQFLTDNSPGTAMDTEYGHMLRKALNNVPDMEFCDIGHTVPVVSFQACLLLSYDSSGKGTFNILHVAHSIAVPFETSPHSSSLDIFHSCWSLLSEICGENATYFEYGYRVSSGSREIQRMMDNLTCEWQDMLIRHYIEASEHGNIWPSFYVARRRVLLLSPGIYTLGTLENLMSDLLRVLGRGVKEISPKCSLSSAKRIELYYERLKYYWYNWLKLDGILQRALYP